MMNRRRPFFFGLCALVLGIGGAIGTAHAAAIAVDTTTDELTDGIGGRPAPNGNCSLREAIQAANTNVAVDNCIAGEASPVVDTITLLDGNYVLTIATTNENLNINGDLDVLESVAIQGTSTAGTVIDGHGTDRIFHVQVASADLSVSDVTLTNGFNTSGGGAISFNTVGTLTLIDTVVDTNATQGAGAVFASSGGPISLSITGGGFTHNTNSTSGQGGAIDFSAGSGSIEISDTTISDNTINNGQGGGVGISMGTGPVTFDNVVMERNTATNSGLGGALSALTNGTIALRDVTVRDNRAEAGGGLSLNSGPGLTTIDGGIISGNGGDPSISGQGGGVLLNGSVAVLKNLTIDSNFDTQGGGIFFSGSSLTLSESTVSNNIAALTASSGQGGGLNASGTLSLRNVTISGNEALGPSAQGGGINFNGGGSSATNVTMVDNAATSGSAVAASGSLTFRNSIITDSCFGAGIAIHSSGHNIDRHNTCGFGTASGDRVDIDPLLGPLAAGNGITLETQAPLQGSPAIDNGDDVAAPPTDELGVVRPRDGDNDGVAHSDIGAVEIGCGDGVVEAFLNETCDDGNTAAGDGCDASCQIEVGGSTTGGTTTGGTTTGGTTTGGGTTGGSSKSGGCSLVR